MKVHANAALGPAGEYGCDQRPMPARSRDRPLSSACQRIGRSPRCRAFQPDRPFVRGIRVPERYPDIYPLPAVHYLDGESTHCARFRGTKLGLNSLATLCKTILEWPALLLH
jgi:hypothetical protein